MSSELVLYDLASKGRCACWSPNVWKTRLVLNYKNIPYRTEWLTHPTITARLKEAGVPALEPGPGQSPYTVPAVKLDDGTALSESTAIAIKLERLYPDRPLHLDNGLPQKVGPMIGKASFPLIPVFMPRIGRDVVVDESADYFEEVRSKRFGMPLAELKRTRGGDQAWDAATPAIKELSALIASEKLDDGPFIRGSEVCYADFLIASMVEALRRIGEDLYERFLACTEDDNIQKLHAACQQWMEKDQ